MCKPIWTYIFGPVHRYTLTHTVMHCKRIVRSERNSVEMINWKVFRVIKTQFSPLNGCCNINYESRDWLKDRGKHFISENVWSRFSIEWLVPGDWCLGSIPHIVDSIIMNGNEIVECSLFCFVSKFSVIHSHKHKRSISMEMMIFSFQNSSPLQKLFLHQ